MAVLNLRGVNDGLAAFLKAEASMAGLPLREYCIAILEMRGQLGLTWGRLEQWQQERQREEGTNGKEKVAEVAAEKAGEIGRENGPAGIQSDGVVGKGGSSRAPDATNGEVTEFVASSELAANLAAGRHKRHHGRQNAEIATGGSAGVAADIIPAGNKPSVRKGASYVNRELLRGDAGSKTAKGKAGVGGAVRDAEFQAGVGKFRGSGKCPHGWVDWMTCRNNVGGCE
jgi:hypothetical protein